MKSNPSSFAPCENCQGLGRKSQRLRKKVRLAYQRELDLFKKSGEKGKAPVRPKNHFISCEDCSGSGLIKSDSFPTPDKENYPHVAIVGGGIGGIALAVACLHRGIPFTIFERDASFDERSQGYGLTLQQASKAMEGFGLFSLDEAIISTRHVVHTTNGEIIGEWGMRKWMEANEPTSPKRTNMHIARQSLRLALLNQLESHESVQWNHQFVDYKESENGTIDVRFLINGESKTTKADLIVGADGIRSSVRKLLIGDEKTPLRYLDCIVILGICPLSALKDVESDLLDSETVFQTANGNERIYVMPFSSDEVMWQLSFPMAEKEAIELSVQGKVALKAEAIRRTQWHKPIPQILEATDESLISGYPVYDREMLDSKTLAKSKNITLIGDAAHPMSPFKGQGANQALLDALSLARLISKGCRPMSNWRNAGIRINVLSDFELEMLERSAVKVKDSAEAAKFLHSDVVLHKSDKPRGKF